MSNQTKIMLWALGIVVVLGGVYLAFFSPNNSTTAITAASAPSSQAEVTFLNLSSELGSITFDTSILSDPRFLALIDMHTAILPESTGRSDPFAPVPGIKALAQ